MMRTFKCSACGAELDIDAVRGLFTCSYCGSKYAVPEDNVFIGWNPELTQYDPEENGAPTVEFSMQADDVFSVTGKGTVIAGEVAYGSISVNDCVRVMNDDGSTFDCTITGIEQFRKTLSSAYRHDVVGVALSGITKQQVNKGAVIVKGELDLPALYSHIASYYFPINDKVNAINYFRQVTGLGLKAAREKVNTLFAKCRAAK